METLHYLLGMAEPPAAFVARTDGRDGVPCGAQQTENGLIYLPSNKDGWYLFTLNPEDM